MYKNAVKSEIRNGGDLRGTHCAAGYLCLEFWLTIHTIICVLHFFLIYIVLQCGNKINYVQVVISVYMPWSQNFMWNFYLCLGLWSLTPVEIKGLL